MTAKADDRSRAPATKEELAESGVSGAVDTLVAAGNVSDVKISGADLLAPTLHASPGGAPADLLPGTILDGVYRVEKEIGRGAMGTVYLVEHLRLGRKFAAKVVSTRHAENTEIGSRLRNEARVASRVQHENIVDVTHLGQTASGALFIVMELLAGSDLRDLMQKQIDSGGDRWLPDVQVRALIGDVMAGLVAAHAAGIVHRDLKPDNIFVVEKGGSFRAKIVDFGISRSSESEDLGLTRDGQIIGTPLYMAPEQARGGPTVDARADIYSLGVLCHELLTGALPFHATSVYDMIVKHATEPPPPVRDTRPDLSEALEAVLLKSLAKKPADRWESVTAMREAWEAGWKVRTSAPPVVTPRKPASAPAPLVEAPSSPHSSPVAKIAAVAVTVLLGAGLLVWLGSGTVEEPAPEPPDPIIGSVIEPVADPIPDPVVVPPIARPEEEVTAAVTQRLVTSSPPGATVVIAGADVCTTPCTIDVSSTLVEAELRLRGYRRETVSIGNGSADPVAVELRRAREAPPALAPR